MINNYKLSQSTIEKLGYYVYLLIDPRDKKIFYVGKGVGNRINQHVLGTLKNHKETNKNNRINEIRKLGLEVEHEVLRHGLNEKEAFEVESAVIDLLDINNLTNEVKGHNSEIRGIMNLKEIKINYEAEDIDYDEPLILININNLYKKGISTDELYEATRKSWKISLNSVKDIKYACSVYRGIVREVFEIEAWSETEEEGRKQFFGRIADNEVRKKYVDKSVSKYWPKGSQNPIKYLRL